MGSLLGRLCGPPSHLTMREIGGRKKGGWTCHPSCLILSDPCFAGGGFLPCPGTSPGRRGAAPRRCRPGARVHGIPQGDAAAPGGADVLDLLHKVPRPGFVHALLDEEKLVPAHAEDVFLVREAKQDLGDRADQRIPRLVSPGVVGACQVLDLQSEEVLPASPGACQREILFHRHAGKLAPG